jgi:radical SAM protein with 4Fe4S-binding SPASM domain
MDASFKVGFDSCSIPAILNYTHNIDPNSIDTCEGGRWSMYITSDMKALPCSFDNQDLRWAYDISNDTIQNAWNSSQFEDFRNHFRTSCPGCKKRAACMGGCPIRPQIVICSSEEKTV